ncbi:MAG: hypothetical protein V4440_13710 [Pseudomonadota bacterium]
MTTNVTATAASASVIVNMPTGLITKSTNYSYSGADITASANALTVYMMKVPTGAQIVEIEYKGSSAATLMAADIGIEVTSGQTAISRFASQVAQGATYFVTPIGGQLPFTVSCPDSQITQYGKMYVGLTPSTLTSSIQVAMTVFYTFQGNA